MPQSAGAWQIYATRAGAEHAARQLTDKAEEICKWIIANNVSRVLDDVVKDECWRVSWPV